MAHHCPTCPVGRHYQHCERLKTVSDHEVFEIIHYSNTKQCSLDLPMRKPRTVYHPLSTVSSWHEYLTTVSGQPDVPGLISPDLDPLDVEAESWARALRASTFKLSSMLTIVAALEAVLPDLATKESLTLHLIGAAFESELRMLAAFEELLHLLPSLKTLQYVLVGPEVGSEDNNTVVTFDCCPACTNANRTRSAVIFKGVYHDFAQSADYRKPDLAVAFNTGCSQMHVAQWLPTLQYLVEAGHPTVFTSYNHVEMSEETELLAKGLGAKLVIPGQKNKWRCMIPHLEIAEEEENEFFYDNMYWYVISGERSGGSEEVVEKVMARDRVEALQRQLLR